MHPETEKIVTIVKEAGNIALKYFTELQTHHISTKDDGSILTIADTEVDHYLRTELEKAFPEYSVLSEESKNTRTTEGVFIIDPIDATKNFSEGNPYFAISVGLVKNNKAEIGVVYAPALHELYAGEIHGHTFLNETPIQISNTKELQKAKILMPKGISPKTIEAHAKIAITLRHEGVLVIDKVNCAALDLCNVASGKVDAFIHKRGREWDIAAGIAILEAAGGIVCHFDGSEKNLFAPNIIGTTPPLKEKLVACILTTGV